MVSKDQGIGGIIFLVCVIIAIGYTVGLFYFGNPLGDKDWTQNGAAWPISMWLIAVPVYLAFILILGIGAWIGWTMATTPPPKPIEELETEEKEEKKEEKPKEE
jgi:TRAP-type C4-dicarboxylate transport system permease small subunit